MVDTPFTTFAFPATGAPTSRTMPNRLSDVFNVKDYGALGVSTDDTVAIRAAIEAMWDAGGGTVFFPPGDYRVSDGGIDIGNSGGAQSTGRIIGSDRSNTFISGNIPNGFIFYLDDSPSNGVGEIANLTLDNSSTWIGSGALRINNSSAAHFHNMKFNGMVGVLCSSNLYATCFSNCLISSNSDATTGHQGTLGIAGAAVSAKSVRTTSSFMSALSFWGSDTCVIEGCGVENSAAALILGMKTGWASACTFAPESGNPGFSIMTVGGTIGVPDGGATQFTVGMLLFAKGLTMPAWGGDPNSTTGGVTITAALTGAGYAGTYRVSGTFTIATPVPVLSRTSDQLGTAIVKALQTEACWHQIYLNNVANCTINAAGGSAQTGACVNEMGTQGFTARCGLYIRSAGYTTIEGYSCSATTTLGSIVFDASANLTQLTMISCGGRKSANNLCTGTISNGAGGFGTILNITALASGAGISPGMRVTAGGNTTTITGNVSTEPGTLTGYNDTGTYRVADSISYASGAITVYTGEDWLVSNLPNAAKTGLKFIRCGTDNQPSGYTSSLANGTSMTFTCLPGEAGCNTHVTRIEGDEYSITDSNTAVWGATAAGGGSNHVKVRFNGTNWTVVGK